MWQHLPRLNAAVVWSLTTRALNGRLTRAFCEMLTASDEADGRTRVFLGDTIRMLRFMPAYPWRGRLHSSADIRVLHDNLSRDYQRVHNQAILKLKFPAPPLVGNDSIMPLDHPELLLEEGTHQHNCIASYAHQVAEGACYLYRLLLPERATFMLTRKGSAGWELAQIAGWGNQKVSEAAKEVVGDWLSKASVLNPA
jgi:hypothetical protein